MKFVDERIKSDFKTRLRYAMNLRGVKAIDLCNATGIPKSAMSYYLSGRNEAKTDRIYKIAKHLDISEAWLIGYDVPMERNEQQKKNDALVDIIVRLRSDESFSDVVRTLNGLTSEQFESVKHLLSAFSNK